MNLLHSQYCDTQLNITFLNEYCKDCLSEPKKIDIEYLIECMGIDLRYAKLSKNSEILGACVFNEGTLITYNEGKPENIIERMMEGKVKKYYEDVCLLNQKFVKDGEKTITDVINGYVLTIGEKITIRRFARFEMGEGLEKRNDDFAAEVAAQSGN